MRYILLALLLVGLVTPLTAATAIPAAQPDAAPVTGPIPAGEQAAPLLTIPEPEASIRAWILEPGRPPTGRVPGSLPA